MQLFDKVKSAWVVWERRRAHHVARIEAFELTAKRSEWLARQPLRTAGEPSAFERLVAAAIDELPEEFQVVLEKLPVIVADGGVERRAYGIYEGDGIAQEHWADRIVIFEDTLLRDFGHDLERLRHEVTRTVRHEIAHHLGWDETGVRGLGL